MLIGYLVPEFPGQTHAFFWREVQCLKALGVDVDLVSTRPPPAGIVSHDWAAAASRRTTYIAKPGAVTDAVCEMLRTPPRCWRKAMGAIAGTDGALRHPFKASAVAVMGARLAALARQRSWSHVHVHSCANSALIAAVAHLLSGLSYSLVLHGPLRDYGPDQALKWRHAAFGQVITTILKAELEAELGSNLPPRLEIAPMGVDAAEFKRRASYQPWRGEGPIRLFSCGRLNPVKGHQDIIDAVALLSDRGISAEVRIAGNDERGGVGYRRTLEDKIAANGLCGQVTLLGAVTEGRVRAELEQAHIFVLASKHEPLGVATMEAMAMQVPVICTRAGGVTELVDHGRDGLLVAPSDPAGLADAILDLAQDPDRCERLRMAGRAKIETRFGSQRSARMIRDILAERGSSPPPANTARVDPGKEYVDER